jgi:hypothetical protein
MPLMACPNIQSNNFSIFIFHENIRCIKNMIRHVRSISINIRKMVSCFVILFHLMRVAFGELDEFLTVVVHPCVVLISHLVANTILDVGPSYTQACTPCMLNLLIFNGHLLLLKRLSLV